MSKWITIPGFIIATILVMYFTIDYVKYIILDFIGAQTKTWSTRNDNIIEELHPKIRNDVAKAVNELKEKHDIKLLLTDGTRTFKEQKQLYEKGRSAPGNIVTNAKPGQSYHNYGLAVDVVEQIEGTADYNLTDWQKIADVFQKYGFKWGASFGDKPHFYRDYNHEWEELKAKVEKGKSYKNKFPVV